MSGVDVMDYHGSELPGYSRHELDSLLSSYAVTWTMGLEMNIGAHALQFSD